ncbi:DUF4214 domain-containing protein [Mesorhizobium sp. CAU 1741]|uniref:DUF4214 domain-containing protein n=1 Tax=Mesorhizobium sp. CAU 1741 TaxID=3140366 RepID=UPI00325C0AAA
MATIQGVYIALFGRPADPLGLAFFAEATNDGADLTAIGDLSASAEYQDRFAGMSNTQIVNSIYQSLFNRDADLAGLTFFTAALAAGDLDINTIAINIYDGAQGSDAEILANKEAAANAFTTALDTGEEVLAYEGNAAAQAGRDFLTPITEDEATIPDEDAVDAAIAAIVGGGTPGTTFTLTTDIGENLVGTADDDTFNAIIGTDATLNTFDEVDGAGGDDTANIIADVAVTAAQLDQFTNVENAMIAQSLAGGQTAIDVSGVGFTNITFGGTTGLANGAAVTVAQGQTINASLDAAGALAVTGAAGVTELTANGVGTTVNAFTFAETDASVTTVNAGGSTAAAVTVTGTATTETANISFEDDVALTLVGAAIETLDMSGSTGDITVTLLANLTSVVGGAGIDSVTDITGAAELSVDLGAGSDVFTINNGDGTGLTSITLGAGNDLVDVNVLANIATATEADFAEALISITDFNVSEDKIDVSGVGTVVADNLVQGSINAAATLYDALEIAGAGAAGDVVFEYAGNTYVYANDGDAVVEVGEGLLELTGIAVADLTAANFTA